MFSLSMKPKIEASLVRLLITESFELLLSHSIFPQDRIWRGMAGQGGVLQDFLSLKKEIFSRRDAQKRN